MNNQPKQPIRFAEFELDTDHRLLRREGKTLALNAKAFDLLVFFTKNAGRVISKDEILDAVWAGQFVEEANLKVQISALRKTLGERKNEHRFLVTVPGKGYKFVADIEPDGDEIVIEKHQFSRLVIEEKEKRKKVEEVIFRGSKLPDLSPFRSFSPSQIVVAAIALLALAIGSFWFFNRNSENRGAVIPPATAANQPHLKRLTNQGRVNRAKISPDGKFFAYSLMEKGSFRSEIRLGQIDGGKDIQLRSPGNVFYHLITFSVDGKWLYYVETEAVNEQKAFRGAFYKIPVLGGVPQKLGDNISIYSVLSPDEQQIAFPRNNRENKTSTIIIADTNDANEREVVARPADKFLDWDSLSWSADASFIAFSAANSSRKNDSSSNFFEIFVADSGGGNVKQLTALEWNQVQMLEWLKDGSGLIAAARSSEQINTSSLWKIDYPGGKIERISRDVNRYAGSLSLSADSNALIAIQYEVETNIWLASGENLAEAKQITFGTSGRQDGWRGLDFTPDGKIIFTAWVDESLTIWLMSADGANAAQLTPAGFQDEKPFVTADGRFIVFQSNRSGANEIWRMNADGADLRQITTDGGNSAPSVSPDGTWVFFRHADGGGSSLRRISIGGGEAVVITDKCAALPRISPDGKFIACGSAVEGKMKLAVFAAEGGEAAKIFDLHETSNFRSISTLRWSPDGRFICYADESNGIWTQDFAGGAPVRLKDIPAERTFTFGWSPDSKQFAYGRVREVREAVLITDFR